MFRNLTTVGVVAFAIGCSPDPAAAPPAGADAVVVDSTASSGPDSASPELPSPGVNAGGPPDAGPPPPPTPEQVTGSSLPAPELHVEVLYDLAPVSRVAAATDGVLAQVEQGLLWLAPEEEPVALEGGPTELGRVATLPGGTTVLLAEGTLWVLDGGALAASPVNDVFSDEPLVALEPAGADLWLGTGDGLYLYRDGLVHPVALPELPVASPLLAWSGGAGAVWVAAQGQVYRLLELQAGALDAWPMRDDLESITSLAADGAGRVWVVAAGDVHRWQGDSDWAWLRLPEAVVDVLPSPAEPTAVWVRTAGALWLSGAGAWWPLLEEPPSHVAVDASGRAVVATAAGLLRVTTGELPEPAPDPVWGWEADVAPLVEDRCAKCHGEGQHAHSMFTAEHWQAEIDDILMVTGSGAMPLPPNEPLVAAELEVIQGWKDGGFQP